MKRIAVVIAALAAATLLASCGLTPKQLQALDGAMCTKIYGATTTIVGGASKNNGTRVDGDTCSIVIVNEARR